MSPDPTALRTAREETIDDLCRRFAADQLSLGELERRLEKARGARTRSDLRALVQDLPPARPTATTASHEPGWRPPRSAAPPAHRPRNSAQRPSADGVPKAASASWRTDGTTPAVRTSSHLAFAVMGGASRTGRWAPPSSMTAVAIMGGVELDFRGAVFSGETIEIYCFAFWGAVEIIVPPGVHVDTNGLALLGGFDQSAELDSEPVPGAPTIRINGLALMGAVAVEVKDHE